MSIFKEIDVIRLCRSVEADILGERASIVVPSGSLGTVVLVHGPSAKPSGYDVEFYVEGRDAFALASVDADSVAAA